MPKKTIWPVLSTLVPRWLSWDLLVVNHGSIHNNIQSTKGVNTHYNIQTIIIAEVLIEVFNLIFKVIHNGNVRTAAIP